MSERKKCLRCGLEVCTPCVPDGPDPRARRVVVASDTELRRISHLHRLAMAAAGLGLSRRAFVDELALVIYNFDGTVYWPNGTTCTVHDTFIDEIFQDDSEDFRWVSDFFHFAVVPPRQRPQKRVLERLRVIDLYFLIKYPDRARLIAK